MRKALGTLAILALVVGTLALTAAASKTWTGWISDSACGAKGANADHVACAKKCVNEKGGSWVFVDAKTNKVIPIANQSAVNADNDLGHEVKVTGTIGKDGSVTVDKVMAADSMMK
jgi:hypothetical protein